MGTRLQRSQQGPLEIELSVTVVQVGDVEFADFTYNPSSLHAGTGDSVRWKIKSGGGDKFSVLFSGATPFNQNGFNGGPSDMTARSFRPGVTPGIYKYSVAMEKGGKLYQDACPEIRVDDGP